MAEEKRKLEEERARKEAERIKREEEARRRKAFEDTVMGAMLGGAPPAIRRGENQEESAGPGEHLAQDMERLSLAKISKVWSEDHFAFYYMNEETNEVSWRDPTIVSNWEKLWSGDEQRFYYKNKQNSD